MYSAGKSSGVETAPAEVPSRKSSISPERSEVFALPLQIQYRQTGAAKGESVEAQKRIRKLMNERGWTDYRLAKEANLSHSTVSNMFNRNNAPTLPTLEAVCNGFGITLVQFFSDRTESSALTSEQQELFSKWSTLTERQKSCCSS